jgi:hypothetical protein
MVMTRRRSRQLANDTGLTEEQLLALDEVEIPSVAKEAKENALKNSRTQREGSDAEGALGGDWHNHLHGDVYAPLVLVFWPLLPVLTMSVHLIINRFDCSIAAFFSQILSGEVLCLPNSLSRARTFCAQVFS